MRCDGALPHGVVRLLHGNRGRGGHRQRKSGETRTRHRVRRGAACQQTTNRTENSSGIQRLPRTRGFCVERLAQRPPGAKGEHLDGRLAHPHDTSDLAITKALPLAQHERAPLVRRDPRKCTFELRDLLA